MGLLDRVISTELTLQNLQNLGLRPQYSSSFKEPIFRFFGAGCCYINVKVIYAEDKPKFPEMIYCTKTEDRSHYYVESINNPTLEDVEVILNLSTKR